MKFEDALAGMREGKAFKREGWEFCVSVLDNTCMVWDTSLDLPKEEIELTHEDIFAEDWEEFVIPQHKQLGSRLADLAREVGEKKTVVISWQEDVHYPTLCSGPRYLDYAIRLRRYS